MTRILRGISLASALILAGLYTWHWAAPALRRQVGPCSVTVYCPGGGAPEEYEYTLVSDRIYRQMQISYDPACPWEAWAMAADLPPGQYYLLAGSVELADITLTREAPSVILRVSWQHIT